MTANGYSGDGPAIGSTAQKLKQALVDFATSGDLGVEFARQKKSNFRFKSALDDFQEMLILDWFIFDWMDESGRGVIDQFLASRQSMTEQERQMVVDWGSTIHNIFEICEVSRDCLTLREVDDRATFTVRGALGPSSGSNVEAGRFLMARLLPVQDGFHFSGPQLLLPDREAALQALEMAQSLGVVVSPGEIEEAQADQLDGFTEFFGGTEVTIKASELDNTLERFERYLLVDRPRSQTSITRAEAFRSKFGGEVKPPSGLQQASAATDDHEITLLCDEFEGIVVLPRYRDFRRVFETSDPDQEIPDWKELIWGYIKDPDIPIVAFEYIAEREPAQLERLLRLVLHDRDFSLEHLYAMLLHYKEPVEGLDDLKDDEKLWDLLDGKQARPVQPGPPKRRAIRKPAKGRRATASMTGSGKASKKPSQAVKRKSTAPKNSAAPRKSGGASKRAGSKESASAKKQALSKKRSKAKRKPRQSLRAKSGMRTRTRSSD
jgi:hypothetical protein